MSCSTLLLGWASRIYEIDNIRRINRFVTFIMEQRYPWFKKVDNLLIILLSKTAILLNSHHPSPNPEEHLQEAKT